jgi:hypothetical protein
MPLQNSPVSRVNRIHLSWGELNQTYLPRFELSRLKGSREEVVICGEDLASKVDGREQKRHKISTDSSTIIDSRYHIWPSPSRLLPGHRQRHRHHLLHRRQTSHHQQCDRYHHSRPLQALSRLLPNQPSSQPQPRLWYPYHNRLSSWSIHPRCPSRAMSQAMP